MAIEIRDALPADIPTIRQIAMLTWPVAYASVLQPGQVSYMLNLMYRTEVLLRQMEQQEQQFVMAKISGTDAGFAAFGPEPGENSWKLHKLYVLPYIQKTGIGVQLIRHAEATAASTGASVLRLNVNRNNPAVGFYKHIGYEISGKVNADIGKGFYMNDYVMQKTLT